jgi:hypothetical protein
MFIGFSLGAFIFHSTRACIEMTKPKQISSRKLQLPSNGSIEIVYD